ncbi:MAG TPA: hypothetical protein VMT34_15945 [Aggregatilineales bacterium]|nr:hypothetical protein [Aggregatilineales bacterium]
MARGLKVGDKVTVRQTYPVPANDPAYDQGLVAIQPGDIGSLIQATGKRSFIVEFKGVRISLSSQRLEEIAVKGRVATRRRRGKIVASTTAPETPGRKRKSARAAKASKRAGKEAAVEKNAGAKDSEAEVLAAAERNILDFVNYDNSDFVRLVANTLLMNGNSPNTILLQELRFADLPASIQQQVQNLVRAKLAMG